MNDDDMEMAEMVISDNNAYLMAMGTGSRIEIHGADAQKETWTALDSTAQAGSNQLVVEDSTGWEVGDKKDGVDYSQVRNPHIPALNRHVRTDERVLFFCYRIHNKQLA